MPKTTSTIEGGDELSRKLDRLSDALKGAVVESAAMDGALLYQRAVQQKAPVDTGAYRASIRSEVSKKSTYRCEVTTGTNAEQAFALEYGSGLHGTGPGATKQKYKIVPDEKGGLFWPGAEHPMAFVMHPGIEAQPHFRPAFDEQRGNIVKAIGAAFSREIHRALGK